MICGQSISRNCYSLFRVFRSFFSGYFVGKSLQRFGADNKVINVRGISQREVKANFGSWTIEFRVKEPTVAQAIQSFKKDSCIIKDFLRQHNFSEKETSSGAPRVNESYEQADKNKIQLEGFVHVSSDNVENMQEAFLDVSQLFTQGVLLKGWNQSRVYTIKNFDKLRPELVEEAVKSSFAVAEKFAHAAHAKVGEVKKFKTRAFYNFF